MLCRLLHCVRLLLRFSLRFRLRLRALVLVSSAGAAAAHKKRRGQADHNNDRHTLSHSQHPPSLCLFDRTGISYFYYQLLHYK
jgi:hypothetical protein